jgi:hypothetical protein
MRLDLPSTGLGLAQGTLSDAEVATKVVRHFFEALIASDYEGANRVLPLGTAGLRQQFSTVKFLRIVSVGPATQGPESAIRKLSVPCTVEIEEDGQRKTVTLSGIQVHPLGGQPDRWAIQGLGD